MQQIYSKRLISALLSVLIFILLDPSVYAEKRTDGLSVGRIEVSDDFLYTADGEGVWICVNGQVYYCANNSGYEMERFTEVAEAIAMTVFDGCLYILTGKTGSLDFRIVRFSRDGSVGKEWSASSSLPVQSFIIIDERQTVLLVSDAEAKNDQVDTLDYHDHDDEGNRYLELLDLDTGWISMPEGDDFYNDNIRSIASVSADVFLASEEDTLYQADIKNDDYLFMYITNAGIVATTGGLSSDTCFYLTKNGIETANLKDKTFGLWLESSAFARNPSDEIVDIQMGGTTLYLKDTTNHELIYIESIDAKSNPYTKSLTFIMPGHWNNSQTDRIADEKFHTLHPDVELVYRNYSLDKLTTALMANETGLDVLVLGAGSFVRTEMATFYKAGVLFNVLEHPGIAANLTEWIDLNSVFGYEGGLYAIPMYQKFYANLFFIDPSVAERANIETPARGWTFEDLYALYDQLAAYNEQNDENIIFLGDSAYMPLLTRQLIKNGIDPLNGTARIDTPEFLKFLEWWKMGINDGMIVQLRMLPNLTGEEEFLFLASEVMYAYMANSYAIYPPILNETDRYPVRPIAYAVNAYGENREYALDYLECLTSPEAQYAEPIEWSQPLLKNREGYAPYRGEQYSDLYVGEYPFPFDNAQLFVDVIENGVDDSIYDFEWEFGDMLLDYIDGELEASELLYIIQEKADMMLGE